MARIVILGDLHFTDEKPGTRIDADFFAVQLCKFDFLVNYCVMHDIQAIGQCGDVFDKKRVSNRVYREVADRLLALKDAGIPFVCTLGQHDVLGQNIVNYRNEADIALLESCRALTVLTGGASFEVGNVVFRGYGFGEQETEEFLNGTDDPLEVSSKQTVIALVHAAVADFEIAPKDQKARVTHISSYNIKHAHWACFGDIHKGFDPFKFKLGMKPVAFSTGAMTRMKRDEEGNIPHFAVLDTKTKELEFVDFPFTEVVFEERDEEAKPIVDTSGDFKERLARAQKENDITDEQLVINTAKEASIEQEVVDVVLGRMEKVPV